MFERQSTGGRMLAAGTFAAICVVLGFYLATGWETPPRAEADESDKVIAMPAHNLPLLNEEGDSPFIEVALRVKPVVVNITAEKGMTRHPAIPFDWRPFFESPPDRTPRQQRPSVTSGGSGIIVDEEGYILTNNHVVSDAQDIKVTFADGSERKAAIVGVDPETDVAMVKVDGVIDPEMVAKLGDSDKIRIGEWAIAIGNPFGLDWTVTVGVISARGRSNLRISGEAGPSYQNFIQTDASINFGNSGGPLVNIHGEVIGVNTAINAQGHGIGFAIPINLADRISRKLRESGEIKRGYLGIYPTALDEVRREALDIDLSVQGVFVESVQPDTPAEKAGLKGGDVILSLDGDLVKEVKDFRFRIADYPPGSEVRMVVLRDGKNKTIDVKLGDRGEYFQLASNPIAKKRESWLGIEVAPLTDDDRSRQDIISRGGVKVIGVEPGSPGAEVLAPGDIIVEIAGKEINTVKDFAEIAEKLKDRKKAIPFWVMRDGRRNFVPIRPEF